MDLNCSLELKSTRGALQVREAASRALTWQHCAEERRPVHLKFPPGAGDGLAAEVEDVVVLALVVDVVVVGA